MPQFFRSFVLSFAAITMLGTAVAAEGDPAAKQAEYKRSDAKFYPRGDILRTNDSSVIVAKGHYSQKGDSFFFSPKVKAPKEVFIEVGNDWIEPITPPDMTPLNIAPDAMQIREPQGDVTVALPAAPGNFGPVSDGMGLPNGAVVRTGPNSSTAILFGGVASARLIPGSKAAVQQTVASTSRSVEIDLTVGGVFSKVGKQVGVQADYEVHTPNGNAIVHGTDFVTLIAQGHTDVWIAQGTVELVPPDAKKGETITSDGTGPLKLLRYPAVGDATKALVTDADALTSILGFIPMANQKVAALRAQVAKGTAISAVQQDYLSRIKQVPAFIKLALVEPPAPPPPPPPPPAPPKPETIAVRADGTIKFLGSSMDFTAFQERLKALVTDKPDQPIIIKASPQAPYAEFQDVVKSVNDAHFVSVTIATPTPQPPPPPPPPMPVIGLDAVGTVFIDGAASTTDALKGKLADLSKTNPTGELMLVKRDKVTKDQWQNIVTIIHDAKVKVHVLNEKEYHSETAAFPPGPAAEPAPPPPPPPPLPVTGIDAVGTIFVDGAASSADALKSKVADLVKTNPTAELTLVKRKKVTAEQWQNVVAIFHDAKLKVHVLDEKEYHGKTAPFPPGPAAEPTPPPPPPPLPVAGIDAVGTIFIDGAASNADALKSKVADLVKTNPTSEFTLVKRPKVTKEQWQGVVAIFHDAKLKVHVLDEKEYHGETAAFPPGPAAEPTPPPPPPPLPITGIDAVGTIFLDGAASTADALKSKAADVAKSTPNAELTLVKRPKVIKEQWQNVVAIYHDAKLKVHVMDEKDYHGKTAPFPPGPAAEPVPPPPPAPLPVIAIDATGSTFIDAAPATDDALKAKFDEVAKTNPAKPLILVKKAKVTREQWQKVVDLAHASNLKLSVVNAKEYKGTAPFPPEPPPTAETPPAPVVPPPTAETPPAPALPAPAAPTAPSVDNAPPAVIGLDTDGSMTWDGTAATEDDLKAKLADLAKTGPKDPLLLLKSRKVPEDRWQKIVTLVHDAKLKVWVKNAPAPKPEVEPKPDYGTDGSDVPPPHLAAKPAPQKIMPVEISLKTDGKMTLEGNPILLDDLKTKLADFAKANSQQPVVLSKTDKASPKQVNEIIAACHDVRLKVRVKTTKTFTPPPPSTATVPSSPAQNLPAPTVTMRPPIPGSDTPADPAPPAQP